MNAAVAPDPVERWRPALDLAQADGGALAARRAEAFARFARLGFPGARDEDWKYTSLRRLAGRTFAPVTRDAALAGTPPAAPAFAQHRAVLVNGFLHEAASALDTCPPGLRITTLGREAHDADAAAWFRLPEDGGTARFAALNAALCGDALSIEVDASVAVDTVLQLSIEAMGELAAASHPRVLVRLAPGAGLSLVVHHRGDDHAERFVNAVLDVEAGERAELRIYRLQQQGATSFHIERIEAALARDARLVVRDASLGASLARLDLRAQLAGRGASAELTGVFLADASRHLDTQPRVEHAAADTTSVQDYRGIAAGRGRGVINSRVVVDAGATKSVSRQTTRNLLLGPGAEIDTKPELEIRTDDVQCNHGASTGQLDPAALFYLRSRGLDERAARSALTRAFAGAVFSRIDLEPFARAVHAEFDARIDQLLAEAA
jgi:Fe-S cluster assembly protein SufD